MHKITSIVNNQQGSVIIVAVVVLAFITILGISSNSGSISELQITTNAILYNTAFYAVESGIEAGRTVLNNLKAADVTSWDKLLNNTTPPYPDPLEVVVWNGTNCTSLNDILDAEGGRTVGPATFSLAIEDNEDLDDNMRVDTDDTIILTATLASPFRNATATITTTVQGGGASYAQEHYNESSSGEAAVESEAVTVSVRW
jgi:hypothetical protein